MTTLMPNSRIVVSQKQQHINAAVITPGELISVHGNTAMVMLEGEAVARTVNIDAISSSDELLGDQTNRPNEHSVIDMSPQRRY